MALPQIYQDLLTRVKGMVSPPTPNDGSVNDIQIPDDPAKLSTFVKELFDDSRNWRNNSWVNRFDCSDPVDFWNKCFLLEQGDHWKVWGSRKQDSKDDWKAEIVDDEISNQVRVKTAYLTANWHTFDILPNVSHISEVLTQEQQKTDWNSFLTEVVKRMNITGTAIAKTVIDFSLDPRGTVMEISCDPASIYPAPMSTALTKDGGCWYLVYATVQPIQKVRTVYAESMKQLGVEGKDIAPVKDDFDINVATGSNSASNRARVQKAGAGSYTHTKSTDVLELWIDDPSTVPTPFHPDEVLVEHGALLKGIKVPVRNEQNHNAHVEAHLSYLAELNSQIATPEDQKNADAINTVVEAHIREHLLYRMDGLQLKYPYGRKITRAGGVIVENTVTPHEFDWHELFHTVHFEKVVGQWLGRGLVEILWNTNKTMDLMICRMADIGLLSVPKPWLSYESKDLLDDKEYEFNNDPLKPGFYRGQAPQFPQGRSPLEFLQAYKIMKDGSRRSQGIGDITYGEAPTPSASGDLVESLLQQNSILVTGEANINLAKFVESIIETRLRIMKQLYTEDRVFYIGGNFKNVNVSRILTSQPMFDATGQPVLDEAGVPVMMTLPPLEVRVKPNSNLPNQWENDFALVLRLIGLNDGGEPVIPIKALYDVLSVKYPQFSTSGEYYKLSQATAVGLQVIQQQQAEAEAQAKEDEEIANVTKGVLKSKLREQIKEKVNGKPNK